MTLTYNGGMFTNPLKNAKSVFDGARFDVRRVELPSRTPGAATVTREACVTADAVVILPMLDEQTVVMIRNHRFAVNEDLWELPAGTMEDGESTQICAERELVEETGYQASQLYHLIDFFPSPGFSTERMHAFVASDLIQVGQNLDENERITVEVLTLNRSMQMIRDNKIRDGKTMTTLLYYQTFGRL